MKHHTSVMDFARHEIEGSLPARFAAVARRYPGRPALRDAGLEWSYRDLDRAANLVACRLPPVPEDTAPVLLLLGHGALEIIALLAVLKSGRAWVALDPRHPPARLAAIAADVGAARLFTCSGHRPLASGLAPEVVELPDPAVLRAAARDPDLAVAAGRDPGRDISPDALASIVYTSGSSGAPKGVMRSHRSALHRCWLFQQDQGVAPGDRIGHLFSCGFVAAEVDVYGALLNGGTLCCYPARTLGHAALADWLAEEGITLLHPPPALWRQFLEELDQPPRLPALRTVFLAGEAVFRRDVVRMRRWLPHCTVVHRLSSSEASVMAQFRITPETVLDDEVLPAGLPVPDKDIRLLDPAGGPVPPGAVGEIVVSSRYLSPGYWRQPELTARRFIPLPDPAGNGTGGPPLRRFHTGDLGRFTPAGRLVHLGRLDEQVKVRGYRVDPREVEAALLGLEGIQAAAVVPRAGPDGARRLVACVVAIPGGAADAPALRAGLARTLPDYMIPAGFEFHPVLPLTPNGKIDRQALIHAAPGREQGRPGRPEAPPRGRLEAVIAQIWREVLGLEEVGRHDDFFSLGGDSLAAARVTARLNREPGLALALPLADFFRAPTIAGLAARLAEPPIGPGPVDGSGHPGEFLRRRLY